MTGYISFDNLNKDLQDAIKEIENIENEISNIISVNEKVKLTENDTATYLSEKLDNDTIQILNNKLTVTTLNGLIPTVNELNKLTGVRDNVQSQINSLLSGMNFKGRIETYADLLAINNKNNGDFVIVLSDETHSNRRSWYAYSGDLGSWLYLGDLDFIDEFIAFKDTPSSYVGQNGKVVKVNEVNNSLVFENINYNEIQNKPTSTITQIDEAVQKSHNHPNKELLDTYNQTNANLTTAVNQSHIHQNTTQLAKINENNGILTYNGIKYVRESDLGNYVNINSDGDLVVGGRVYTPKERERNYLSAYANKLLSVTVGGFIKFDQIKSGSNIEYNPNTGLFKLKKGKKYRINVELMGEINKWIEFGMAKADGGKYSPYAVLYGVGAGITARGASGSLNTTFDVGNAADVEIGIQLRSADASDNTITLYSGRTSLLVEEY